ncbi:hypothetical protein HYW17_02220 [Candidatus Uhrbacteria bacterium]|nr:hypothetical protein [Candidatus Uhrbacteria bacterium]
MENKKPTNVYDEEYDKIIRNFYAKREAMFRELISIIHGKQMLTDTEVQHIITMEPFPQLSV